MKTRFYQVLAVGALCLAAAALAVALWSSVLAQEETPASALAIPTTLNYQGHLREPDGTLTTGTFDITARIYNIATGGSVLYETSLTGVTVRDGLFNIVLGDEPALPSSVFANAPLYIGISLNGEAELIPRQRLHAVPWAFQASTLINNAVAQTVQGLTSNGDVTVNGATALNGDATVTGDIAMNGSATVGGDLTVTGNLARSGETSVGPHFLATPVVLKSWGACPADGWHTVTGDYIPPGATAAILEYDAADNTTNGAHIYVRKENNTYVYTLAYVRAGGSGDVNGWGGQGIFPILEDGSFQWGMESYIEACSIRLIGYYK